MDEHKQNIIRNITQQLDSGCDCYFNVQTEEIISIPDFSDAPDEDEFKEALFENGERINKLTKELESNSKLSKLEIAEIEKKIEVLRAERISIREKGKTLRYEYRP